MTTTAADCACSPHATAGHCRLPVPTGLPIPPSRCWTLHSPPRPAPEPCLHHRVGSRRPPISRSAPWPPPENSMTAGAAPSPSRRPRSVRNGHDFTERFPSIALLLNELPPKAAVLDGEVVAQRYRWGSELRQTARALDRAGHYHVAEARTDCARIVTPRSNGRDRTHLPLRQRAGCQA